MSEDNFSRRVQFLKSGPEDKNTNSRSTTRLSAITLRILIKSTNNLTLRFYFIITERIFRLLIGYIVVSEHKKI